MNIGEQIHAIRRYKLKANQDDIARKAGVSRNTIIAIERGDDVKLSTIIAVCKAMGMNVVLEPMDGNPDLEYARQYAADCNALLIIEAVKVKDTKAEVERLRDFIQEYCVNDSWHIPNPKAADAYERELSEIERVATELLKGSPQ